MLPVVTPSSAKRNAADHDPSNNIAKYSFGHAEIESEYLAPIQFHRSLSSESQLNSIGIATNVNLEFPVWTETLLLSTSPPGKQVSDVVVESVPVTPPPLPPQQLHICTRVGPPPIQLYLTFDDTVMSHYQCFVRKYYIELFEVDYADLESSARGRNKPIVLGQVGIRCRCCNGLPPNERRRGAMYYPSKLDGIYQAAHNLAIVHIGEHCQQIDDSFRNHLVKLRNHASFSCGGGGKKVWAEHATLLGVYEDSNGLRFEPCIDYRKRNYLDM